MAEATNTPAKGPTSIDFSGYYQSIVAGGQPFNPAVVAQAFSNIKKEDPSATMDFSDESFKGLSDTIGEEEAKKVKQAYVDTLELNDISDKQDLFAPVALKHFQNDLEGIQNFSKLAKNELQIDPVFRNNSIYKPFQYRTFQEAAESNSNYFDADGTLKKLKDSEDYDSISGGFGIGFGGSSLTVATNAFVAEYNPELKKAIDEGMISADAYYKDEEGQYAYRKLRDGEQNMDHVRSIFGPRTLYGQGLLRNSAEGLYDGVLGLIDGAGAIAHYGQKGLSLPMRAIGFKNYDNHLNDQFNDFVNMTARMKSNGSDEEDRGVTHSLANFSKAVFNGIGQIVGTMGTGYAVGLGMKGVSSIAQASKLGKLSGVYAADFASGTTRALNFGIAAKAGKEESLRHGLSKDESDMMGLISGAIMMGTEYMTGSQFIPKMAGKAGYSETTKKVTQYFIAEAEKQGIKVGQVIASKPQILKEALFKAHQWLESSASNRALSFAKGFTGEAIQETSEDFSFSLVKEGYDMLSGKHSFDQNWGEVGESLMGSFLVGGFSGGLTKFATFSKKKFDEDQIDETRNNLIVNEVAAGNSANLKLAVEDAFIKGELGSKTLSATRDENGKKVIATKGTPNAKTENEFFRDVFLQQIDFADKVYSDMKLKGNSKQEIADLMFEAMGQESFNGESSLEDLSKGITTAIEIEAMQTFRMESVKLGNIALAIAKSKAPSTSSKVHQIEAVRMVNDMAVAVRRKGETEWSEPSVEERTGIEMSYLDVTTNTKTGFKGKFDMLSEQLSKAVIEKKNLETQVERFNEQTKISPYGLEKMTALEEAIKEEEKISNDFKKFVQDEGLSPELIEDAVQLVFLKQFKDKLTNGERSLRYVKNYRINNMKAKYKDVFKNRPEYNIEDFLSDKNGFDYLSESSVELIKDSNNMTEQLSAGLKQAITNNDINEIISLVSTASDMNVSIKGDDVVAIGQFIDLFLESFSEENSKQYVEDLILVASVVSFVQQGQIQKNALLGEGLEGLVFSDNNEEFAEGVLKNMTLPDILGIVNTIDKSGIGEFSEFTQESLDEFINETIPRLTDMKGKFDLIGGLNESSKKIKGMKRGLMKGVNVIDAFSQNQNLKMKFNYSQNDSIEAVLEKRIKLAEESPKEFIDNGVLPDLVSEIRKNQRYILSRILEVVNKDKDVELVQDDELSILDANMQYLEWQLGQIENLMLISDRNRGDRFKRDYEVKIDYINSALENLKGIDRLLTLGINEDIAGIDAGPLLTSDARENVDMVFEKIIELEEIASEKIQSLTKEETEAFMDEMVFNNLEPKDKGNQLFKSFNEDQKKPFNPNSERDKIELRFNYIAMLSRGNIRDFFTLADQYIKARTLSEEFIPSQEQILISRFLFSKLATDKVSEVEQATQKAVNEVGGAEYDPNIIFVRGAAGTGKTTMVLNFTLELVALKNKQVSDRSTLIGYSAPIAEQIENVKKSLDQINSETVTIKEFKVEIPKDTKNFKDNDLSVIDEATVFGPELGYYLEFLRGHNKDNKKQIKVVLVGDELQKSGTTTPEPYLYANGTKYFMERTVPSVTPYRSGKVDSFDLNGNQREVISELAKLYMQAKRGKTYTFPDGKTVPVSFIQNSPEFAMLPKYASEIIADVLKSKTTVYYQEGGVMKYGVRAYQTPQEVIEKFAGDYSKKTDPSGMVLITENPEYAVSELKVLFKNLNMDLSDAKIGELVKLSEKTQGLTFPFVYSAIEQKEEESVGATLGSFQSMYVGNSREKEVLVMVSPFGTVDSKEVLSKDSVPSFSELNFEQKEGKDLIGDSLELFNNNKHIGAVIERLAGKLAESKPVTIEISGPEKSNFHVNEEGELNETEESEDIDETLTEPKPQSPMDPEDKKEADEEIKNNDSNANKILDELDNMTDEELLSDDIDLMDMFKGCNI